MTECGHVLTTRNFGEDHAVCVDCNERIELDPIWEQQVRDEWRFDES